METLMRKGERIMGIGKNEILWETMLKNGKPVYRVTSDPARQWYYLYEVKDGKDIKVKKAKSPKELYEWIGKK